jgi:hypothetical protein
MTADMVGFLVLLFPLVLLVFVLLMERVEQPMSRGAGDRALPRRRQPRRAEYVRPRRNRIGAVAVPTPAASTTIAPQPRRRR